MTASEVVMMIAPRHGRFRQPLHTYDQYAPAMTTFGPEHVAASIAYLSDERAVDRASTVRYTAVFEAAGLPAPQELHDGGESDLVSGFMKAIHDRCIEEGLPPLDALVVHVAGRRKGMPGPGYFTVNGHVDPLGRSGSASAVQRALQFWENQKAEIERWGDRRRRGG